MKEPGYVHVDAFGHVHPDSVLEPEPARRGVREEEAREEVQERLPFPDAEPQLPEPAAPEASETKERRPYVKWTLEHKQALVEMYKAGCSVGEMARVFKRDKANIRSCLYTMGYKFSEGRSTEPDWDLFDEIMRTRRAWTSEDEGVT